MILDSQDKFGYLNSYGYKFDNIVCSKQNYILINVTKIETNISFKAKIINNKFLKEVENEINCLSKINSKLIPKLYDHFENENFFFLIFENFSNTNLFDFLNNNTFDNIEYIINKIINYIFDCNVQNIFPHNILCENIYIDKFYQIKIINFENSKTENYETNFTLIDYNYLPPEVIMEKNINHSKIDSWMVGVLIFKIFSNQLPFGVNISKQNYLKNCKNLCFVDNICSKFSLWGYFKNLLNPNIEKRLFLKEIIPFLKQKNSIKKISLSYSQKNNLNLNNIINLNFKKNKILKIFYLKNTFIELLQD